MSGRSVNDTPIIKAKKAHRKSTKAADHRQLNFNATKDIRLTFEVKIKIERDDALTTLNAVKQY
jgi:hypothetical protein